MKKFDPNDPKWTAYVLNELDDAQRAEVEKEIEQNPEAKALVDEIRETTAMLSESFAAEPEMTLDAERRDEILNAASKKKPARIIAFPAWKIASLATAAAALLVAVIGVQVYNRDQKQGETEAEVIGKKLDNPVYQREEFESGGGSADLAGLDTTDPVREISAGADVDAIAVSEVAFAADQVAPMPAALPSRDVRKGASRGRVQSLGVQLAQAGRMANSYVAFEDAPPPPAQWGPSLDDYSEIRDNAFMRVADHPLSTLSIDVDTASYAQVRKSLLEGYLPVKDAVRVEEMINYFPYDYAVPTDEHPFAANMEIAPCPWNPEHRLVRIALKGKELDAANRPPLNLVFLLDVSGSMESPNKLPLLKRSMKVLVNQLTARDRVAIVVYAGAAGLVLPATAGDNAQAILDAIERLQAGGSTAGGAGIELAYKTAEENFDREAVNRVILCTDGDFNVGMTQRGDLVRMIEEKAKSGVFLNVLGFGMGNYKDSTLEDLSNKGNGNYAYIDDFSEARKVLVDEMTGTLVTIAKDVKIQVEFNPARVAGYRLIGYENRLLRKEDFNDDTVDAGEIGAGHTVTAFYEIVPAGQEVDGKPPVDPLKYQSEAAPADASTELLTLKLRYKQPTGDTSTKVEYPLTDKAKRVMTPPSTDFRFAASVAAFGQLLRESEFVKDYSYDDVIDLAKNAQGDDPNGYRAEFVKLVRNAKAVAGD